MASARDIRNIEFIGSFKYLDQCPDQMVPEYAFVGRSNVGKSSFINYLLDRKDVARVSSNPGKTQSINIFHIDQYWSIADLPGYGYAKVSKKERKKWQTMIDTYLLQRKSLVGVFLLMDFSVGLQDSDWNKAIWLAENQVPFALIFTKVDRIKKSQRERQLGYFVERFAEEWQSVPKYFKTSSSKRMGRELVIDYIEDINAAFYQSISDL